MLLWDLRAQWYESHFDEHTKIHLAVTKQWQHFQFPYNNISNETTTKLTENQIQHTPKTTFWATPCNDLWTNRMRRQLWMTNNERQQNPCTTPKSLYQPSRLVMIYSGYQSRASQSNNQDLLWSVKTNPYRTKITLDSCTNTWTETTTKLIYRKSSNITPNVEQIHPFIVNALTRLFESKEVVCASFKELSTKSE